MQNNLEKNYFRNYFELSNSSMNSILRIGQDVSMVIQIYTHLADERDFRVEWNESTNDYHYSTGKIRT